MIVVASDNRVKHKRSLKNQILLFKKFELYITIVR